MNNHGIGYRGYQVQARDAAFLDLMGDGTDADPGVGSTLVVMPTGTGKTVLAGMCVEEALYGHGLKTLFVAHREVLITQAFDTLQLFGFDCAVEMAAQDARKYAAVGGDPDVVVGSVQTLQDDRLLSWPPDTFGLVIVDECHRALTPMYAKLINHFSRAKLLGITATPSRGDARNLGSRFRTKAFEYRLREAIRDGWLVEIRTRTCRVSVDLRGIKVTGGGDFMLSELEERIGPQIESLARAFQREIGARPAVFFAPDVGSAMAFAQVLTDLGTPARYVAGTGGNFGMSKAERKANLDAYKAREYQVVVCNELLVEGWDCPHVEAVGIGRPTLQQYRYTQMVGRGTRPSPATGKADCLVVDFDWETDPDVKDLCSTVDLFDDGMLNDEVYAEARRLARERAVDVDPLEVIEEAERVVRTRQRFAVRLTGKEAVYESWEHDPVGVSKILDIKLNRKYDLDRRGDNPASAAQLGMLRSLGVEAPESLSKWGASKLITKLMKRKEAGMASARQVQTLLSAGMNVDLARRSSAAEASEAIGQLASLSTKKQGVLFQ
jgi:superfamily II DNA or RNA helicase